MEIRDYMLANMLKLLIICTPRVRILYTSLIVVVRGPVYRAQTSMFLKNQWCGFGV